MIIIAYVKKPFPFRNVVGDAFTGVHKGTVTVMDHQTLALRIRGRRKKNSWSVCVSLKMRRDLTKMIDVVNQEEKEEGEIRGHMSPYVLHRSLCRSIIRIIRTISEEPLDQFFFLPFLFCLNLLAS